MVCDEELGVPWVQSFISLRPLALKQTRHSVRHSVHDSVARLLDFAYSGRKQASESF
jgi:hypothetical protein